MDVKTVSIWILSGSRHYTESSARWINSLGCELTVENHEPIEVKYMGGSFAVYNKQPTVTITTTTPEQESYLKLKFGEDLLLQYRYPSEIDLRGIFLE